MWSLRSEPTLALSASSPTSTRILPPDSYSCGFRNLNLLFTEREVRAKGNRWHTPAQHRAPPSQPGEQKEEGRGLPFEGRLCLVCREEKVPMTAPMAAKTCVQLGTSGPAPPSPGRKAMWTVYSELEVK